MDLWAFLSDPANQKTLAFFGGGITVAAGGLWLVVKHFSPQKPEKSAPPPPTPTNTATAGTGIAATGNVTVRGGVQITGNRMPRGGIALVALGVLAIGIGYFFAGDTVCGAVKNTGTVSGSTISVSPGSVTCD